MLHTNVSNPVFQKKIVSDESGNALGCVITIQCVVQRRYHNADLKLVIGSAIIVLKTWPFGENKISNMQDVRSDNHFFNLDFKHPVEPTQPSFIDSEV